MKLDTNVVLGELTSVDKMLDTIKASEQAKTALTSELAEVNGQLETAKAEIEQNGAKVSEMEAKIAELEAAVTAATGEVASAKAELEAMTVNQPDTEALEAEVNGKIEVAVTEALAAVTAEHLVALSAVTAELDAAKAELEANKAAAEAAAVEAAGVAAQVDAVVNALDVQGIVPETDTQVQDVNLAAAITARYEALANSRYPAQKAEARKLYAKHKAEIVAYLDSKTGTTSAPVADSALSTISDEQMAQYNAWLAEREVLASKVSRLTTEQLTTLHVKNRRTYSANKELFDRCFAARSVKEN